MEVPIFLFYYKHFSCNYLVSIFNMNKKFTIPNKSNLTDLKFDYIDSTIDQYYRPVQGYFMQKRLG